ncbi:SDR family oxidoreductase [Chitinophaga agri]|uniref:SDR family oxidoreductase n=1 Tax=Chitinophaga agri TaxID=2703787 RepID=A0A6B9ZDT7_9BACT|nr:SDR family oxidoreductase [Chitinophaga agri]QHS59661.1 SDR family oxidoreductase [Chitinophaga agri]
MRIFVTGATGFIGSAIVQDLIKAGHEVLGLARNDAAAQALVAAGAAVHRGSLEDLESLRQGAAASDSVVHTAFNHDFSRYKDNCEDDRHVIEALGNALAGTDRPLVVTSGTAIVVQDRFAAEEDRPASAMHVPRAASEEAAAALAARGINVSILRLPPSVHGDGDRGFVPALIQVAREKGVAAYIADGANRWPAVHRLDAASAYRLILEKGEARPVFHAVHDEGVAFKAIATVIGSQLNLPVVSISREQAAAHFGWLSMFAGLDVPATSVQTRAWLNWQPTQPGLLADLEHGTYFGK